MHNKTINADGAKRRAAGYGRRYTDKISQNRENMIQIYRNGYKDRAPRTPAVHGGLRKRLRKKFLKECNDTELQ